MASRDAFVIETSPNWRHVAGVLLKDVSLITEEEMALLTRGAALEMKLAARMILDDMVYGAPLPPSASFTGMTDNGHPGTFVFVDGEAHYLERSRTGRTRNAIKSEQESVGPESIARAFVDPGDYAAYFYAKSLEFGMLGRYPTYYPRPFWSTAVRAVTAVYPASGIEAARKIVARVNGRFA